MTRSENELRRLATPEFSRLLASDPELQRLNALKTDRRSDCALLLETLMPARKHQIGRLQVSPLTAAKWALLWLLDSPFVTGEMPSESDCDIALYVLHLKEVDAIPHVLCEIPVLASGYTARTALPSMRIAMEIRRLCDTAFRPLTMLPPPEKITGHDRCRFDAVWLNRLAGIAAREANVSLFEAMQVFPLSMVCCCYVNYLQRVNPGTIRLRFRPDAALTAKISARVALLEEQFLKEAAPAGLKVDIGT